MSPPSRLGPQRVPTQGRTGQSRERVVAATLVYVAMALIAAAIAWWRDSSLVSSEPLIDEVRLNRLYMSLGLGLFLAAAMVLSTKLLVHRTRWASTLHSEFRVLLGPLSHFEIAVFALTSGVGEELLFRGALQPWWGLVITSVVFGLVHVGPNRRFVVWTVWAGVVGFLLGGIVTLTGEVAGAILAHVTINYLNLHFINRYAPPETQPED